MNTIIKMIPEIFWWDFQKWSALYQAGRGWEHRETQREGGDTLLTMTVIMMGRPYSISLVDSIRMTVRLMVILTTPPRNEAAPMSA